jgi:hypothetical protein
MDLGTIKEQINIDLEELVYSVDGESSLSDVDAVVLDDLRIKIDWLISKARKAALEKR